MAGRCRPTERASGSAWKTQPAAAQVHLATAAWSLRSLLKNPGWPRGEEFFHRARCSKGEGRDLRLRRNEAFWNKARRPQGIPSPKPRRSRSFNSSLTRIRRRPGSSKGSQEPSCAVASGTDGIRHVPSSEHCGTLSSAAASPGPETASADGLCSGTSADASACPATASTTSSAAAGSAAAADSTTAATASPDAAGACAAAAPRGGADGTGARPSTCSSPA